MNSEHRSPIEATTILTRGGLTRDYERLPEVLGGLHFLVFAVLMLPAAARVLAAAGSS
nr:hypothetical protein [Paracidovorax citrulli]